MSSTADDRRLAYLDSGDFSGLFIEELGWDRPRGLSQTLTIEEQELTLNPVAEYRGVRIWSCNAIPEKRIQRAVDSELKRDSTERLVIFYDGNHQEWRWPLSSDSQGRGSARIVTHEHVTGNRTESLLQRLNMIRIGMDEEPSVVEVVGRLRRAFDADAVTRSFYARFADEAKALSSLIKGIKDESDRDWYAALLLNRLMFIYFMQRKGFMDSDPDYLRDRLEKVRSQVGPDQFFHFYSEFLLPLFHEGLGSSSRPLAAEGLANLIGDVPYVNGGIFDTHTLESTHSISVPDSAFESIFNLFDQYRWHLDDRPTGQPNEINPDVLGYIFEQFINNKEQGAYYTKEDVTYFMTASTLLPAFLERLSAATHVNPWANVTRNPARYIWQSMAYGSDEALPDEVKAQQSRLPRPAWKEIAPESHALPGESWWEVSERRHNYLRLRQSLGQGEIASVHQAVRGNIDLETLAIDVIDALDTPEDVAAAWKTLGNLRVIDPTCGSGAFLFAAMKILEALYLAVLDAAERHALTSSNESIHRLIEQSKRHPSREYFVLKHAAISNLYGVDLMNEAVEIARLRLFLKLVSTINRREDLEPLPDLDFNIKVGNILVGALNAAAIAEESQDIFSVQGLEEVERAAIDIAVQYNKFQVATENADEALIAEHKRELLASLSTVRDTINRHMWNAMPLHDGSYDKWLDSHEPFHWFIEFPEAFASGGFDVVIGNPPYIAKRKLSRYGYSGFETDGAPDIYAPCVERAIQICAPRGFISMIVPISGQFSRDFLAMRGVLDRACSALWLSTYSRNPAALFDAGVGVRSTIIVGMRGDDVCVKYVTKTHRWCEEFRPALFETLKYVPLTSEQVGADASWPRSVGEGTSAIVEALYENGGGTLKDVVVRQSDYVVGAKSIALYWLSCFTKEPPSFDLKGNAIPHTAVRGICFADRDDQLVALALLSSKVALYWWATRGDDFNVTSGLLTALPINPRALPQSTRSRLRDLGEKIEAVLPDHVQFTKYAVKWMGNYVLPEIRDLTDEVDWEIAAALGYADRLEDLELFYATFHKPTGERPGTLRHVPEFDPVST